MVLLPGCGLLLDLNPSDADGGPFDASADAGLDDSGVPGDCGNGVVDGDEICDDGNGLDGDGCDADCRFSCVDDGDCDDGDDCTIGSCDQLTHVCLAAAISCAAPDACRVFLACAPEGGCLYELIDDDDDGHASVSLGACGDDCDDTDATRFPGAVESCDGIDQDCDGRTDEGSGTVCGEDADNDGFGSEAETVVVCAGDPCPPNYVEGATDCWDEDRSAGLPQLARPGQETWFEMPRGDDSGSYDWNCDGTEEPRYPNRFASCITGAGTCASQSGWGDMGIAACGERQEYVYCMNGPGGICMALRGMGTQACR